MSEGGKQQGGLWGRGRGQIQFLAALEMFIVVEEVGPPFSPCAVIYAAIFAGAGRIGLAEGTGEGFGGGFFIGGRVGGWGGGFWGGGGGGGGVFGGGGGRQCGCVAVQSLEM